MTDGNYTEYQIPKRAIELAEQIDIQLRGMTGPCKTCDFRTACIVLALDYGCDICDIDLAKAENEERGRAGAVLIVTLADGSPPLGGECLRLKGKGGALR